MKISFDPGMTATGWCIWHNGKVLDMGTIRPKGGNHISKINDLCLKVNKLIRDETMCFDTAAIEKFEPFYGKSGKSTMKSMMLCSCIQGILVGTCISNGLTTTIVSKGRITKEKTRVRAKCFGILDKFKKPSKDALDAWEIGLAAGFDSNWSLKERTKL
jgi:Holliday junction resolvasome RuvABC endonuclease subunit